MELFAYCCLLLPVVVDAYYSSLFNTCYSRYGLEDNRKLPFYAERCRSMKKAVICFDNGLSDSFGSYYERYLAQNMVESIRDLTAQACAFARITYCPANYLNVKMKSCATLHGVTSMTNMTAYYAKTHYWSLRSSLSCMEAAVKVCPDDDLLQSYIIGIRGWRIQLDKLSDHISSTPVYLTPRPVMTTRRNIWKYTTHAYFTPWPVMTTKRSIWKHASSPLYTSRGTKVFSKTLLIMVLLCLQCNN